MKEVNMMMTSMSQVFDRQANVGSRVVCLASPRIKCLQKFLEKMWNWNFDLESKKYNNSQSEIKLNLLKLCRLENIFVISNRFVLSTI